MKKILCCAAFALAAFSLSFGQTVPADQAARLAGRFFQQKTNRAPASMEQVHIALTPADTKRGVNPAAAPRFYVFEPGEDEGYVVVAAEAASTPVLGYSLNGRFPSEAEMPPAMRFLLQCYQEQLDSISAYRVAPTEDIRKQWENGGVSAGVSERSGPVAPLLSTTWGQRGPYNQQCPPTSAGMRALTGCVATAMAQIMRYWNFPSKSNAPNYICLTDNNPFDPNSDVSGTWCAWVGGGYQWSLMLDAYPNATSGSDESRDAVAQLMYHCGIGAQMDYGTTISNALAIKAAYAMDTWFGYSDCPVYDKDNYSSDWKYLLQNTLAQGRPIYYGGDNTPQPNPDDDAGHAWVVDGHDGANYFHMNWGWDGNANDYFLLTDLTPQAFNFNNHQHMFIPVPQGICPLTLPLSDKQNNVNKGAAHWIHSNATVNAGAITAFHAGNEITLTDGFWAENGSDFHAFIQGCDFGLTSGGEDRMPEQVQEITLPNQVTIAPNPFSGSTLVTYHLPAEQQATLLLLDATGKLLSTPVAAAMQAAGPHEFTLDAAGLPAGLYFLVLQTGEKRETKRLILTR